MADSRMPPIRSAAAIQQAAARIRRSARELSFISGRRQTITEATDGGDVVGAELLAQAADEHLDRVRLAIEILVVDVLDQLRAGDDLALVVHEVVDEPELLRRELDGDAADRDPPGAGVDAEIAAFQLRRGVAGGAADEGADAGQHLLHLEGL